MLFNRFNVFSALLLMADENTSTGSAVAEAPTEAPTEAPASPEAAPGCDAPDTSGKRVIFPALQKAGGVFRCTPDAAGTVHFTIDQNPVVPEFPVMRGPDNAVIPYPWDGHNRSAYLALTKDCFDTEAAYFFYRCYELHSKYTEAVQDFIDSKNGVKRTADTGVKKAQAAVSYLATLSSELSGDDAEALERIMAKIRERTGAPLQAAPAEQAAPAA